MSLLEDTLPSLTIQESLQSQSISDPFSGLISDPTARRSILLRTNPLSGPTPVPVDLSSDGYTSKSDDTPATHHFEQALIAPYNFSVSIPIPDLCGATQLGVGNISIDNKGGRLDTEARLDWLAIDQDLYLGPYRGPTNPVSLAEYTNISRGVSAGVAWDLDTLNILNRDARFKIQRPLHKSRYKGFGAALRLDGVNDYGQCTLACPAGNVSFTGAIRINANITAQKQIGFYRNGTGAGSRLMNIGMPGTNRIGCSARNDSATLFSCDAPSTHPLVVGVLSQYAIAIDVTNSQMRLYLDLGDGLGWQLVTTTAISGTWNTVLSNYSLGILPDTFSLFLPADIDEARIYSGALTLDDLSDLNQREALGVETGLYSYYKFNEGSGTSAANSVAGKPSLTLTGSPVWVGSLEGDSPLSGTVKPAALGVVRQVEPKLVDSQRLVYQWHDGSMQALTAVRDSGDPITFGVDVSDIYSVTPSAGTYNTCLAKGLSRHGSTPVGVITGDVQGDNGGSLGYADTASEIDRKLMVDYGGLDNLLEIDDNAYDQLQLTNDAVVGRFYDSPINIDVASNDILSDIRAWGGPTRLGVKTVGRIDNPEGLTPTVSWTTGDIEQSTRSYHRYPFGVRYKEIVIGYRPYYRVLSPDQVAGAVSLGNRDDFGKQYRYVSKKIDGAPVDGAVLEINTSMDSETDAREEMERLADFLGQDLELVDLALVTGLLTHFVGTVISLTITQTQTDGTAIIRYNTNGKKYVVLSVSEVIAAGQPDRFGVTLLGVNS